MITIKYREIYGSETLTAEITEAQAQAYFDNLSKEYEYVHNHQARKAGYKVDATRVENVAATALTNKAFDLNMQLYYAATTEVK